MTTTILLILFGIVGYLAWSVHQSERRLDELEKTVDGILKGRVNEAVLRGERM